MNSDSGVSFSERNSIPDVPVSNAKTLPMAKASSFKVSEKPAPKIPENLILSLQKLRETKQETAKKLPNLVSEIDFESLERGILAGHFSSPEEFESTAKQVFGV
mmetsp:Transcript_29964/g.34339  ORF Transcript_29964/g.34339 Transcript_29964/m.34339 type:complete len:104 (+) Transcript_29964:111-422(+)